MRLYKCKLTGDDLFTDAVGSRFKDLKDEAFYCVKGVMTSRSNAVDESAFGFNASAEEPAEAAAEDGATSGIDIEIDSQLQKNDYGFPTKEDLLAAIKLYVNELKTVIPPGEMAQFQDDMKAAMKFAVSKRKKVDQFYNTSSLHECGMPVFMIWEVKEGDGDQDHPYFYFWKGGVKDEKC